MLLLLLEAPVILTITQCNCMVAEQGTSSTTHNLSGPEQRGSTMQLAINLINVRSSLPKDSSGKAWWSGPDLHQSHRELQGHVVHPGTCCGYKSHPQIAFVTAWKEPIIVRLELMESTTTVRTVGTGDR
ncbi:hypothetical protein K491DRAFT_110756 [Lophiostoma macrostomum CBS 122681]|uniref:Secreted protein n=1 Tax=Lophiostoma macrostomum CBS 122681 TaxID=1314788 RepID=A0A6A6SX11_9PLEO|nr:hypothetical protein K491DRAFT_110756 [Lophiostoma macrostomum CBS 122681]